MQVARGRQRYAAGLAGGSSAARSAPAVALGNFDGVHLGHQALVAKARALATADRSRAGVLTFDPHPTQFFAPTTRFPLLVPLERRLELLGQAGADFALVETFDAAFAALTPEAFVQDVLIAGLAVAHVVIGYDFCFGKKRAGNAAILNELGRRHGFGVHVVPAVQIEGTPVSSTKVRELLAAGEVEQAQRLLGRPPEIEGEVVRGAGRGRGFGIPTANVQPAVPLTFATGIYAARAHLLDRRQSFAAAVSVGTNPTFTPTEGRAAPITVEAYLLDYPGEDLYGSNVRLAFERYLRPERRFDSVEALRAEIDRDIARTREIIQ